MTPRRLARSLSGAGLVCAAVALASATGASRRADSSCLPVYGSTATAEQLASLSCQKIIDQTITSSHGPTHVTIWARTPSTPTTVGPLAYRALNVIRDAIAAYDSFGGVSRDIAVAMGSGMGPWRETRDDREAAGVTADAWDDNPREMGEQCAVDINLERTHGTLTPQGYRHFLDWVVAHEVFHCLQDFNWPALNAAYSDNHAWWAEGQAEYFPALLLPGGVDGSLASIFPEASRIQDVFHMGDPNYRGYPNAVLFMYLDGPQYGSDALYRLFRDFPPTDDFDAQASYLAAHSFDEIFDGFARAFADGAIPTRIPGYASRSVDPAFEGHPIPAGDGSVFFSANGAFLADRPDIRPRGTYDPLHLYRGQFTLPPKKVFHVSVAGGGMTDLKPAGFDWIRSPGESDETTIETCEAPQVVTAVATTVDPHGGFTPEIKISEVSDGKPVCGEKDRCLIGRWHVDQAPLDRITSSLGARTARSRSLSSAMATGISPSAT